MLAWFSWRGVAVRWRAGLAIAAVVVAIAHLLIERPHWQMVPAYLALILALLQMKYQRLNSGFLKTLTPVTVVLLQAATITASMIFPMFSLPAPTGPYAVGTRILNMVDVSRRETEGLGPSGNRELVVQVWYPAQPTKLPLAFYRRRKESSPFNSYQAVIRSDSREDAPVLQADKPFPVIIYDEGWRGRRTGLTSVMEDLASHGYIAIAIDYPYVARRVQMSDGHVVQTTHGWEILGLAAADKATVAKMWNEELRTWAADQTFVLNTLHQASLDPQSPWYGRVNTDLAGAFGHSFGGDAALYVADTDPRVHAALSMDGTGFDGIQHRDAKTPLMLLFGPRKGASVTDINAFSPAFQQSFEHYGGYAVGIDHAEHGDFEDEVLVTRVAKIRPILLTSDLNPKEVHGILRSYIRAFFDKALLGKDSDLLNPKLRSPFPEVTFMKWDAVQSSAGPAK